MKNKILKNGAFTAVAILLLVCIIVVVNMTVGALPSKYTKYDTTGLGLYDLTEETEQLVKAVNEDIIIYHIARDGMEDQTIAEFLNRYAALNSKIEIKNVDPELSPSITTSNGTAHTISEMAENSVIVSGANRDYQVPYDSIYTRPYSDEEVYYMQMMYGQSVDNPTTFEAEQAITSALDNVTSTDLPKLYTLTGHNEMTFGTTYTDYLKTDNYETAELSLMTGTGEVPADADCIIINTPATDITATELESLKAYVDGGGKLILITIYDTTGTQYPNIKALGEYYGLNTAEGMVMESNSQNYYQTPYYLIPNLATTDTITAELAGSYVLMPMAQGLTVAEELREGVSVSKLLTTTSDAYTVAISGDTLDTENKLYEGELTVGAVATVTGEGADGKFVWYTSYGIVEESIDSMVSGGNAKLFLATLASLCEKQASVSIAGKVMSIEGLVVTEASANLWTTLLVIVIPVVIIIGGVAVWAIRRRK